MTMTLLALSTFDRPAGTIRTALPGANPMTGTPTGKQRLPNDSIGSFVLTLTNLVVGSSVRIELQGSGALVEFRTAASTSEVFTVPAYSGGSPNNDLRIKVRKGTSAPFYKALDTQATAVVGAQSIYIAQIPDD